jgi:hypothetical protein
MNMNLNLSLKPADLAKLLPALKQAQGYLVGVVLIAVFAYTAWVVNAALNVAPAAAQAAAPTVTFDKATIQSLKNLSAVQGNVPTGSLGSQSSPF